MRPKLDLVAVADDGRADHPTAVDRGAVGGAEVAQHPQAALPAQFGVHPGDRLVAEPQPVAGVAADAQGVAARRVRQQQLGQPLGLPGPAQPSHRSRRPRRRCRTPAGTSGFSAGRSAVSDGEFVGAAGDERQFHPPDERVVRQPAQGDAVTERPQRPVALGVGQPRGVCVELEGRRHAGDCRSGAPEVSRKRGNGCHARRDLRRTMPRGQKRRSERATISFEARWTGRTLPDGPAPGRRGEPSVQFEVWAPQAGRVDAPAATGVTYAMERDPERHGLVDRRGGGRRTAARYGFAAGRRPVRPDPRSRRQPDGPDGLSAVVDHGRVRLARRRGPGAALPGAVLYELHVGTYTPEGTLRRGGRAARRTSPNWASRTSS